METKNEKANTPMQPVRVEDGAIKMLAERALAMAPAGKWSQQKHVALIAALAVEHGLDESSKQDFKATLGVYGIGGNASQFSQWLVKEKLMVKVESVAEQYDL